MVNLNGIAEKMPVISRVEEVPGLVLACGFTGHVFGISPASVCRYPS